MDSICMICSYPYRLEDGERACVDIFQVDEEYYQLSWLGDDGQSRGADFYGLGSEGRAHEYAKHVQDWFVNRLVPTSEVLNPPGPRYM